jgi:C_GCAxxG_C_C family probable redox protein
MDGESIPSRAHRLASEYESNNRGCAQCSLAGLQDTFEMADDDVFRSASGLAGGIALTNLGTCGALAGGCMAISMLFGRRREEFEDPDRKRMVSYRLCKQLAERFVEEYGSVLCRDIQEVHLGREYDLWDEEDSLEFNEVAYIQGGCPTVVGKGAEWAAEIIMENKQLLEDE